MGLPPLPPSPSQNAAPHFISVSPYTSAPPPLPCSHMCDDHLPFLDSPSFPRNTSQSHACTEETCTVELTKKTTRNLLQSSVFSRSLSTGASRMFVSLDLVVEGIKKWGLSQLFQSLNCAKESSFFYVFIPASCLFYPHRRHLHNFPSQNFFRLFTSPNLPHPLLKLGRSKRIMRRHTFSCVGYIVAYFWCCIYKHFEKPALCTPWFERSWRQTKGRGLKEVTVEETFFFFFCQFKSLSLTLIGQ